MALTLNNFDENTRLFIIEEIDRDSANGRLYISSRLNSRGQNEYPQLLRVAAAAHDDAWLAAELRNRGLLKTHEEKKKPKGGSTIAKVPESAPDTLAEGEINRFYIRGVCLRAMAEGIDNVIVYRAKPVSNPRRESEALIGKSMPAEKVLQDIREHPGIDTALGLPPGPNSGLSVRLP